MKIVDKDKLEGCTRVFGGTDYKELPVRDVVVRFADASGHASSSPAMETEWLPTPEEQLAIAAGAAIRLRILGSVHPPVMLGAVSYTHLTLPTKA